MNDIWAFLPDPAQAWYFRSSMGPGQGYVFDTLGEPHGAAILPGEDALERLFDDLGRACDAAAAGDAGALREIAATEPPALPDPTTAPIREAWRAMTRLLREAGAQEEAISAASEPGCARARAARDAVIRKSVEMRLVATLVAP